MRGTSKETREKISEKAKLRYINSDVKDKISKALKGRKKGAMSEETKRKISESVKKTLSEKKV